MRPSWGSLDGGNSKCKGPKVEEFLVCSEMWSLGPEQNNGRG